MAAILLLSQGVSTPQISKQQHWKKQNNDLGKGVIVEHMYVVPVIQAKRGRRFVVQQQKLQQHNIKDGGERANSMQPANRQAHDNSKEK